MDTIEKILIQAAMDSGEDFVEHYGVKGMKWGQRKAARQNNRAKNKAAKQEEKETQFFAERRDQIRSKQVDEYGRLTKATTPTRQTRDRTIDRARKERYSGKARRDFKKAKGRHPKNKEELGSWKARQILKEARLVKEVTYANSNARKDGYETTMALLADVGNAVASSAARQNQANRQAAQKRQQDQARRDVEARRQASMTYLNSPSARAAAARGQRQAEVARRERRARVTGEIGRPNPYKPDGRY